MAIYAPPISLILDPAVSVSTYKAATNMENDDRMSFISRVGFLAGLGPAFAKDVDDNVAPHAAVEVYTDGKRRASTLANEDGHWRIDHLDHTLVYDVVGRYSTYDAVISRDRIPKLMPLTSSLILDETRAGQKVWRISLKNFRSPFTVNYNGNPITATTDQDTGIIEFFVGFDGTTYTATITDSTGRTYDYLVVAPSP